MSSAPDDLESALRAVILDYGWSLTTRPARLRAALNDAFGSAAEDYRGVIDSLVVAAEEGVAAEVRTLDPADARRRVAEFERRLVDWGMTPERARSTVRLWLAVTPDRPRGAATADPAASDPAASDGAYRNSSTDPQPPTEVPQRPRPAARNSYSVATELRSDPVTAPIRDDPARPPDDRSRHRRPALLAGGAVLIVAVIVVIVVVLATGGPGDSPKATATCGSGSSGPCPSSSAGRSTSSRPSRSGGSSAAASTADARLSSDEQALVSTLPRNLRVEGCTPVASLETVTVTAAVNCRIVAQSGRSPTRLRAYRFADTTGRVPFLRNVLELGILPKGPCLSASSLRTTWHYAGSGRTDPVGDPVLNGATDGGGLFCYRLQSVQYILWDYVDPAYPVVIQAGSTTMSKRELYDWWRGHAIR